MKCLNGRNLIYPLIFDNINDTNLVNCKLIKSKFRTLWVCIISLLIFSSLFNYGNLFIYSSLTSFQLFLIELSGVIILSGAGMVIYRHSFFNVNLPIIVFFLWGIYLFLNGLLIEGHLNPYYIYILLSCFFVISMCFALQIDGNLIKNILLIIVIASLLESAICICQYMGFINSLNGYFVVTGTYENPNVSAMFLAMSISSILFFTYSQNRFVYCIAILTLISSLIALIMLECRTAILGVICSIVLHYNYRYDLINLIKNKLTFFKRTVLILFFVVISYLFSVYMYNLKSDSVNGRILIWKLSMYMILEKPICGYGYGSFEKNYNLFQSKYFQTKERTNAEIKHAGFVNMAYNELIENTVEGGAIGLLIISGLFTTLILAPIKSIFNFNFEKSTLNLPEAKKKQLYITAYSGVFTFFAMSLINFTFLAIPVMIQFLFYSAILSTHPFFNKNLKVNNLFNKLFTPIFRYNVGTFTMLVGLYVTSCNVSVAYANTLNKRANIIAYDGQVSEALKSLNPLAMKLNNYASYWENYGNILLLKKDYNNALLKFNTAKVFTSNPAIFLKAGFCNLKIGNYDSAETNYTIAKYIDPERLSPRIFLMDLYMMKKDTLKSYIEAKGVLLLHSKIQTRQSLLYKERALLVTKDIEAFQRNKNY